MTEQEMETVLIQLTGRMAMLEALNSNMLAYFAMNFDQPIRLASFIMAETSEAIRKVQPDHTHTDKLVQQAAIQSFDGLSDAMLAMVTRVAKVAGRA